MENINESATIRLAGVVRESIVDGPGIRFVVFCQGCPHHCKNCHNAETHSFSLGFSCEISKILNAIDENPLLSGVTFSGGEPVCQPEGFLELAKAVKKRNLNIIMYSGYTFEQIMHMSEKNQSIKELLTYIDILIDGQYDEEQRDLTLMFRGSRNQRVIDVKETLTAGEVVISDRF